MPVLPKYRSEFTNRGEKEIYNKAIKSSYFDSPKKYFFHSLRSHKAKNKLVGEVDFVYLDDQFIIFLESKGGAIKYISSEDQWYVLGGSKKGDPFAQVTDYLFYLRNVLLPDYFPKNYYQNRLIFGYGVMFPDTTQKLSFSKQSKKSRKFKNESIEYDPEIVYTSEQHDLPGGLIKYIEHLKEYWLNHDKYSGKTFGIGIQDLDNIRKFFRKDLIFEIPVSKVINKESASIDLFTEDQFTILDTFDMIKNMGMMVIGGPGTGKTVLAKELLVRQAYEGKKCAYFCFNKNLAGEIQRYFKNLDSTLDITSWNVHHFLVKSLNDKNLHPENQDKDEFKFWNTILPLQFKQWYHTLGLEQYDFLLIDEAQDIFHENLIDAVFMNLKRGVESGNWSIFIDHKYQGFYKGFDKEYYDLFLKHYSCNLQILPINCRNHPDIIEVASIHSGLDSMPCRRTQVPFKTRSGFYSDIRQLKVDLNNEINSWLAEGILPDEITILTLDNDKLDLIRQSLEVTCHLVNESHHRIKHKVSLATVHSYKGLENDFILVLGIDKYDRSNKELMSLIFVAYSRAKMGLSILMDERIKLPLATSVTELN